MKPKNFIKNYLTGFFIGLILFTIVGVSATAVFPSNQTTYNNGTTGMSATNVQTAIDELYNTCFPPTLGDQILENIDLEKDPYECRYFFTGANPNNYITFNGENAGWQIISVECDGTIKIMRNESIGNKSWDIFASNSNNWSTPVNLNIYLNGIYLTSTLNNTAQKQIISKDWSIGTVVYKNNNLENQINNENGTKWNGKVALPTVSEYLRTNSDKNNCKNFELNENNHSSCKNTTWMFNSSMNWWTLSALDNSSTFSLYVEGINGTTGGGNINSKGVISSDNAVRPSVYLSSDIQITGGNGSQSNPYQLSL